MQACSHVLGVFVLVFLLHQIGHWEPITYLPSVMNLFCYLQKAWAGFEKWWLTIVKHSCFEGVDCQLACIPSRGHWATQSLSDGSIVRAVDLFYFMHSYYISVKQQEDLSSRVHFWNVFCYLDKMRMSCTQELGSIVEYVVTHLGKSWNKTS